LYKERAMWNTKKNDNDVKVVLPDGSEDRYDEVTADEVNEIALDAGLASFEVKDSDGEQLEESDFPVKTGTIVISEYNEAKLNPKVWTLSL
tara:strand:- start:872 stop:1144 length:273 start_codon:yes stop_codon:yes gene_type:complete